MRRYVHRRHEKSSFKVKKIENIAATLHQTQVQGSGEQSFSNTERPIFSDVLGSYTGMTYDDESPVQDADDL